MRPIINQLQTINSSYFFPPSLTLFISFTILNGVFIKKVAKYLKKYEIFKNILISTFYTSLIIKNHFNSISKDWKTNPYLFICFFRRFIPVEPTKDKPARLADAIYPDIEASTPVFTLSFLFGLKSVESSSLSLS